VSEEIDNSAQEPGLDEELNFEQEMSQDVAGGDEEEGSQDDIDDLRDRVDALENKVETHDSDIQVNAQADIFTSPFVAKINTDGTFQEAMVINGSLDNFMDGRANDSTNQYITLPAGYGLMVEMDDVDHAGKPITSWVSLMPSAGTFPVLVNPNSTDGDGLPTYDLYALTDSGLTTRLNSAGPLPPLDSRMRGWTGIVITAAVSGSVGVAYYRDGVIVLDHCEETGCVA
jgi:hypothetical protein